MDAIFIECFGSLIDPRIERTKKHMLLDIISLAICGILSGAETWEEIEDFGTEHLEWFKRFLSLPNGIPSHDTISRVFSALDPQGLQQCCMEWLKRIAKLLSDDIIAIDGKSLYGSKRLNKLKNFIDGRWVNLNSIARITYTRTEPTGEIKIEYRHFITSLTSQDPARILNAIRSHWQVENNLHWSLDVTFKEDDCRIRDENAAVNFSWLRKFALGLLKNESSFKASIRRKQRKVCTNISYLAKIIGQN